MSVTNSNRIRQRAENWIKAKSRGKIFHLSDLYADLYAKFKDECDARGIMDNREPRYQHDARQAIRDCKARGIISQDGSSRSGRYRVSY